MFKIRNKKLLMLAGAAIVAMPLSVNATTTSINATANFLDAIVLGNEVAIDFGNIEFSDNTGAGDTATIGTDGNIAFVGDWSGAATGTVGEVEVTSATTGNNVEVFCDASATLSNGAGVTVDVTNIEVVSIDNADVAGNGAACNGVAGVAAMTYLLGTDASDTFLFGGVLDGDTLAGGPLVGGAYSTANAGGSVINIDISYQ